MALRIQHTANEFFRLLSGIMERILSGAMSSFDYYNIYYHCNMIAIRAQYNLLVDIQRLRFPQVIALLTLR